jgi:hypothetical protein
MVVPKIAKAIGAKQWDAARVAETTVAAAAARPAIVGFFAISFVRRILG